WLPLIPMHQGAGAQARAKWCRRPVFSTASGCSARRQRTHGQYQSALPGAEPPRTRPGSMDRQKGYWRLKHRRGPAALVPLAISALNARREVYRMSEPQDLRGPVMLAALGLLALDALVVFWLAGGIARLLSGGRRRPAAAATLLLIVLGVALWVPSSAQAQNDD